ncbi:MAG: sulfatase [Deltaproteobacteria bacterium]|jgi:arylsulfatase A-like enzyme|nr:sulfatase [Deltaproteobacteria bacterium]
MVVAAVYSQLDIRLDPRPLGEPADIETLHERDDLNLLFVLIDTLRADRLSTYGYERETSPTLDKLAVDGIRFSDHMAQSSWTKCSMSSLWTGLYPVSTGVTRSPQGLPDEAQMPAEIIREAGFRTAAIWRNGWISPGFGFSQGFEVYHSPRSAPTPMSVRREKPTLGVTGTDQDVVNSAIEFLRAQGDERWFLYLHLMDVHQYVYDEDTALFGTTYSDIYDNSIRWTDRVLGSLIHDLDVRGLRDKTMIVVAGDHGEAFGEHGREGHARDVQAEVTTTPLIVSLPFRLEPGIVVDTPTENVDLWPTILDMLKLQPLENVDGESRMPELMAAARGETLPPRDTPRYAHLDQTWGRTKEEPRPMVAVKEGPYRLVRAHGTKGWLYNRTNDPFEQIDIGEDEPEVLERFQALADEYLERPPAPWQASDVELDDAQLEQLRALGYQIE